MIFDKELCTALKNRLPDVSISLESLFELCLRVVKPMFARTEKYDAPVIGLLGLQGTGKTLLCRVAQEYGALIGKNVAACSIDDFYLGFEQRLALQKNDPRFKWRGPPGTHDIGRVLEVLSEFKNGASTFELPVFDKSLHQGQGDRVDDRTVSRPDIFILEGWFVGCRPLPEDFEFEVVPWIKDAEYSRLINSLLKEYCPVWNLFDVFVCYLPQDYQMSLRWRQQAEASLRKSRGEGMSAKEVKAFVEFFWQSLHPELFVAPFFKESRYVPQKPESLVDGVILLDNQRAIVSADWK